MVKKVVHLTYSCMIINDEQWEVKPRHCALCFTIKEFVMYNQTQTKSTIANNLYTN